MKFIKFLKHILVSTWRNSTPLQAALITALLITVIIIMIISVVQILVPFTYIAI